MALGHDQRTALTVLAFLFFRMGMFDKARRAYAALVALESGNDELERLALAGLAAAELETNAPESALEHVMRALEGQSLSTRQLPLLLLKARVLWRQNRRTEARAALESWASQSGSHALAEILGKTQFPSSDPDDKSSDDTTNTAAGALRI